MEVKAMKSRWIDPIIFLPVIALFIYLAATSLPDFGRSSAWGDDDDKLPFPKNATVTTLITTPRLIEGLTGDNQNNLYTGGWGTSPCPVWQINLHKPSLLPVGFIQSAENCILLGIAFNEIGDLFVADGLAGIVYTFTPNSQTPPNAVIFASGAPGANSMAFDKKGNLWLTDGVTGQGRVWKITGPGANCTSTPAINCEEVFRVQPMANEVNLNAAGVGGVGRDVRVLPQGAITVTPISRNAADTLASQPLVANGIAFDKKGETLFIADTARGAIWKATFSHGSALKSKTGCDTTFTPNTLCLDNVFFAHPYLEGADGIALDQGGNIYGSVSTNAKPSWL
jgi:hypothetical protein